MLILVTGLPGSGKSTVARLLAEELEAVVLNSDLTRRALFPESRSYTPQETQAVIRETERQTREMLRQGETVILDALFTKQRPRDAYRRLAEQTNVPFTIVHVSAPEEATRERLELRQKTGDASEATFAYYLDRKPHFEPIQGEHISIQNSGDLEELQVQVKEAVLNLKQLS